MKRLLALLLLIPLATGDPAAPTLRGVVLDPDGNPLPDARVWLLSADASCILVPGYSFLSTTTDGGGGFSLDRPPVPMDFYVEHTDHPPVWGRAERGAILRMRRAAYIEGTIPEGCRVSATVGLRELAASETPGEFRLGPLPPGKTVIITALSNCHRPFQQTITLGEGERRRMSIPLDDGLAVTGRVVPATPGVVLRASQGDPRESRATSDETGAFRITGLRDGQVCIVVLAPGEEPRIVCAKAGEPIEVRLHR